VAVDAYPEPPKRLKKVERSVHFNGQALIARLF